MTRTAWIATLPLIIVFVTVMIYVGSLDGEFIFDDDAYIVHNENIRTFGRVFHSNGNQEARPTVFASLALNYALGGLAPKGYHIFNLLIHILAMLTLYRVVHKTLNLPKLRAEFERSSHWWAFAVGLIWSIHPLQADCVAYVFQRSESMQSLFYLLALYGFIGSASNHGRRRAVWITVIFVASAFGMGCKATFITLPLVLLLFDRVFLSRSFAEAIRHRWFVIFGSALIVIIVGAAFTQLHQMAVGYTELTPPDERDFSFGFAGNPLEYYRSQPTVILSYLKLAFLPGALCLDYNLKPVENIAQIVATSTVLLLLVAMTGLILRRFPLLGFCLAFMFIVLAPSTIYWKMELMFAYRMYLSLAGLVCFIVFAIKGLLDRLVLKSFLSRTASIIILATSLCLSAFALGGRTIVRNRDFRDSYTFYRSVVETRPENPRGLYNLANRLVDRFRTLKTAGRDAEADAALDEAVSHYKEAIRLFPKYIDAHINLAVAYGLDGQTDALIEQLKKAVTWYPSHATALFNLAQGLGTRGLEEQRSFRLAEANADFEEAVIYYRRSLTQKPSHNSAIFGLGTALYFLGRYSEAVSTFEEYLRYVPQNTDALRFLADSLFRLGRWADAKKVILRYLEVEPTSGWGRNLLKQIKNHFLSSSFKV
jgi:tetratricopeptide (TPR) repeat protein